MARADRERLIGESELKKVSPEEVKCPLNDIVRLLGILMAVKSVFTLFIDDKFDGHSSLGCCLDEIVQLYIGGWVVAPRLDYGGAYW